MNAVEPPVDSYQPSARRLARERARRRATLRSTLIALASTAACFLLLAGALVGSPGWPRVRERFLDPNAFAEAFPKVLDGFWLNIKVFLIAEPLVLVVALALALLRSLRGPVFAPLRLLAVGYVDLFRGLPVILVLYVVGFGLPGLQLRGVPSDPVVLGVIALTLTYSAYVAEVFRAGIESVHPSQWAAARALGLGQWQTTRHVVLPQAVRRVTPPLLNDFVSLQKDTALVATLGPLEALRQAQVYGAAVFDYTAYFAAALLFTLLTVPTTRLTDWLAARTARRRGPGNGR